MKLRIGIGRKEYFEIKKCFEQKILKLTNCHV